LLVLLVIRELSRSSERPRAARVLPVINLLAGVMIVAFSAVAVLRLGLLVDPPDVSAQTSATPTPVVVASVVTTPPPLRTPTLTPNPSASPSPAPAPTPSAPHTSSASPRPTPSPPATPTATPRPSPTAAPTPTPTPDPSPSPAPAASASPQPTPDPSTDPAASYGTLTLPTRFTDHRVTGRRVTGFKKRTLDAPITARGVGPRVYRIETLGDPSGRILLVRILEGPLKGVMVNPEDQGVEFQPD